jgi:hypothetical protein
MPKFVIKKIHISFQEESVKNLKSLSSYIYIC